MKRQTLCPSRFCPMLPSMSLNSTLIKHVLCIWDVTTSNITDKASKYFATLNLCLEFPFSGSVQGVPFTQTRSSSISPSAQIPPPAHFCASCFHQQIAPQHFWGLKAIYQLRGQEYNAIFSTSANRILPGNPIWWVWGHVTWNSFCSLPSSLALVPVLQPSYGDWALTTVCNQKGCLAKPCVFRRILGSQFLLGSVSRVCPCRIHL